MRRAAGGALAAVLLAAGCAASPDPGPGTLAWTGCGDLQCASLTVPLDHTHPDGEKIEISVIRRASPDPSRRIGEIVTNPGGPGASGVALVRDHPDLLDAATRERFDLIGFDPRGVGRSAPVRCLPDRASFGVEGQAAVEEAKGIAATCAEKAGRMLPFMTTDAAARDLDLLRAALGRPTLTYLGFSYGTLLGATYADLYPTRIRAMVLDGPVDPLDWYGDHTAILRMQAQGFQSALEAFYSGCGRNPRACPFGDGDPAGALGRLLARLDSEPAPVSRADPVDRSEAVVAIASALYDEKGWPALGRALQMAENGDGSGLRAMAGSYGGVQPDGTRDNSQDAFLAVRCADSVPAPNPDALDAELRGISPLAQHSEAVGDPCRFWTPVQRPYHPGPVVGRDAPPILVIGTTGDPATPLPGARAAAARLQSGVLMTVDAWRHIAYGKGSDCVDAAVSRYLVDLVPPPAGTACPRVP